MYLRSILSRAQPTGKCIYAAYCLELNQQASVSTQHTVYRPQLKKQLTQVSKTAKQSLTAGKVPYPDPYRAAYPDPAVKIPALLNHQQYQLLKNQKFKRTLFFSTRFTVEYMDQNRKHLKCTCYCISSRTICYRQSWKG